MKKKITAVTALSLVLAILLSVSGFAASATKTEALLDKVSNSKQISVTMTAGDTAIG